MIREDSPYRLLVEGPDDKHSVIHLIKRHGVDWDDLTEVLPCVYDCGGFDALLKSIAVSAKSYERLGIMVDANADLQERWTQVRNGLSKAGVILREPLDPTGAIVSGIYPDWRVGVWVMPDNQTTGELEDFLAKLVPAGDKCWDYAREATQHAREIGAKFPDRAFCSASIHAWLAWQKHPGLPFGTAITAKYFRVDSPEALKFTEWFKQLFF